MKKIKKSAVALLVSGTLLGGVVGYAGSTIFDNLNSIRSNFDAVFNIAKTNEQKAADLKYQLANATSDKAQLEQSIEYLKQDIEQIKNNHSVEITNKNAEIQSKQDEINAKQEEVNAKQNTINQLTNDLSNATSQLAQAEAEVSALLNYTSSKVNELTE